MLPHEYTHLSVVKNMEQQNKKLITCKICEGLLFDPLMCKQCKNHYCSSHKDNFPDGRCSCLKHLTTEINQECKKLLKNIHIVCSCKNNFIGHRTYQYHKKHCNKPQFKRFYVIIDGQKSPLSELQNASVNFNLINKNYYFVIASYQVDLKRMRGVHFLQMDEFNMAQNQKKDFIEFGFVEQTRANKRVFWFYNDDNNPYQPYSQKLQEQIQNRYKHYSQTGYNEEIIINSLGKSYVINLKEKKQFREKGSPINRQICRLIL